MIKRRCGGICLQGKQLVHELAVVWLYVYYDKLEVWLYVDYDKLEVWLGVLWPTFWRTFKITNS
jgi:hypothetical protein